MSSFRALCLACDAEASTRDTITEAAARGRRLPNLFCEPYSRTVSLTYQPAVGARLQASNEVEASSTTMSCNLQNCAVMKPSPARCRVLSKLFFFFVPIAASLLSLLLLSGAVDSMTIMPQTRDGAALQHPPERQRDEPPWSEGSGGRRAVALGRAGKRITAVHPKAVGVSLAGPRSRGKRRQLLPSELEGKPSSEESVDGTETWSGTDRSSDVVEEDVDLNSVYDNDKGIVERHSAPAPPEEVPQHCPTASGRAPKCDDHTASAEGKTNGSPAKGLVVEDTAPWDSSSVREHQALSLRAVIVDMGSTGTRVHVFEAISLPSPKPGSNRRHITFLLPEQAIKTHPGLGLLLKGGLSTNSPILPAGRLNLSLLSEYFDHIKTAIDEFVPPWRRPQTPVWLFGTAGLRNLLPTEQKTAVQHIHDIVKQWPYASTASSVSILDGQREGVYSWAFANMLLHRKPWDSPNIGFIHNPNSPVESVGFVRSKVLRQSCLSETPSVKFPFRGASPGSAAVVEIGGASAQVVTEVNQEDLDRISRFKLSTSECICGTKGRQVCCGSAPISAPSTTLTPSAIRSHPQIPHVVTVSAGDKSLTLFSRSYHGYGRQQAFQQFLRRQLELNAPISFPEAQAAPKLVHPIAKRAQGRRSPAPTLIVLPCLPANVVFPLPTDETTMEDIGYRLAAEPADLETWPFELPEETYSELISLVDPGNPTSPTKEKHMVIGAGHGNYTLCKKAIEMSLLNPRPSEGSLPPLDWSPLPFALKDNVDILAVENVFHVHYMLGRPAPQSISRTSVQRLKHRAKVICQTPLVQDIDFLADRRSEVEKANTGCFGLTYVASFLERTLDIPKMRRIDTFHEIDCVATGWVGGFLLVEFITQIETFPNSTTWEWLKETAPVESAAFATSRVNSDGEL